MKVGVIGAGSMGQNHIRVLSGMLDVSDICVYDPHVKEIEGLSQLTIESEFEKFLANNMMYCVISTPTSTHHEIGLSIARCAIPALIEKPLATSLEDGLELQHAFEQSKTFAAVGHVERFNPAIIALRESIEAGLIGEIIEISTHRVGPFTGRVKDQGVINDLASHDVDLVHWISGSEYSKVHCQSVIVTNSQHEDFMTVVGKLSNGVLVRHVASWVNPIKQRSTSVLGTRGLLVADTISGEVTIFKNPSISETTNQGPIFSGPQVGEVIKPEIRRVEPLLSEHLAFQNAILGNGTGPLALLDDGVKALRVLKAFALNQHQDSAG